MSVSERSRLEMLMFAVVLGAGVVLAAVAVFGGSGGTAAAKAPERSRSVATTPQATPSPAESSFVPVAPSSIPPVTSQNQIVFLTANANGVPNGVCQAHLDFTWTLAPPAPPNGSPAIIKLTGPGGSRRYVIHLKGLSLKFSTEVQLHGGNEIWDAYVLSIGGRSADSFQSPSVTFNDPSC